MELIHRTFLGEVDREASEKAGEGVLVHPISSLSVDSHGTIVWFKDTEWDGKQYKTTARGGGDYIPILDEHGGGLFGTPEVIGINQKVWVTDDVLMAKSRFDLDSKVGKERYRQHREGFKKGWSIGFVPSKVLKDEEADEFLEVNNHPARGVPVYLGSEIWEYSSVVFPSNPDAYNSAMVELKREVEGWIKDARNSDDLAQALKEIKTLKQEFAEFKSRAVSEGGWKAVADRMRK